MIGAGARWATASLMFSALAELQEVSLARQRHRCTAQRQARRPFSRQHVRAQVRVRPSWEDATTAGRGFSRIGAASTIYTIWPRADLVSRRPRKTRTFKPQDLPAALSGRSIRKRDRHQPPPPSRSPGLAAQNDRPRALIGIHFMEPGAGDELVEWCAASPLRTSPSRRRANFVTLARQDHHGLCRGFPALIRQADPFLG